MAMWNKVLSGFNADDETVNFGARTLVENHGSIFETTTLATVQSDGEVHERPNVSASIQYSRLCVAIDKSITIFQDETCQEIVLSLGFDSLIKTYRLSKDGTFVLIALDTSVLHCLHVPSGGKQVFYENIEEEFHDGIVKIFLRETESHMDVAIVATSGAIYGIMQLNTKLVHSALMNEEDDELSKNVDELKLVKIFEGTKTHEAARINVGGAAEELSIITIGKNIHFWPSDRRCPHENALPFSYKKVQFFDKYGAIACLRDDGFLSVLCPETLLSMKIWDIPVVDFVSIQDDTDDSYQLIVLTAAAEGAETTTLMLLSFPDFECKLEISVPRTTYLVDLVGSSPENIVFLEGVVNGESRKIDTIRVKAIVENKPEYRLERLLRRGQFEEAESFARKFNLSLDHVNVAKAAALVSQLGPWSNNGTNDPAKFQLFISTLDKIKDVKYVYDCCNNALTSNYKQTRQLLVYASQRITQQHVQESTEHDFASLLITLNSNLKKLETFEFIRTIKNEDEQDDCRNMQEWIKFSKVNLLQECLASLSLGEMEVAAAIWSRHLPELAPAINSRIVNEILNSISDSIDQAKLRPWLSHFVPSVISLLPSALPEIIMWADKKTRSLEKYNRKEWPQIGLDFARYLINLFTVRESCMSPNCNQLYMSRNSHLHRLMALVQSITDLLELKTHHRIVLPLQTYLDDPTNVVHQLLNKAHVEAIPRLIETFLQPYILSHSLKNDQVFCSYVQSILRNSKSWWFWEKAPWEERISIVIEHIRDVQNRLQQTVDVLGKAPVPWSSTVIKLAETASNFDHPLVSKIRTESNGVTVKLILKKYGYAQVGLCTKLFRYIIKQDRVDMIDDITELTKSDSCMKIEAFTFCINHLLSLGHIDRALEILQNLDDQTCQHCCQHVICVIETQLRLKERDAWLAHYMEALGSVQVQLRKILSSQQNIVSVDSNDSLAHVPILKRIYKLQQKYSVWLTLSDYYSSKELVLKNFIDRLASDVKNGEKSSLSCSDDLEKVCHLLGLPILRYVLKFFYETGDTAVLKRSITRMSENGIASEDDSRDFKELCTAWIKNADRDPETSRLLLKLCTSSCWEGNDLEGIRCHSQVAAYVEAIGREKVSYQQESGTDFSPFNLNEQSYTLYTTFEDAAVPSGNELSLALFKDCMEILDYYENNMVSGDDQSGKSDSSKELEIETLVMSQMRKTKHIQNEHHGYAALCIARYLHYSLAANPSMDLAVLTETRAVLSSCLYTLLRKLVSARALDVWLGLSCFFMLTESEASEWLTAATRSFQGDLLRRREVVHLGCEYYRIINRETSFHVMYNYDCQKLLHRWARRVSEYGIPYQEMFASDMEQKRNILERLMHLKTLDLIPLLENFCDDFGFNKDETFLLYLEVLLNSWQPRMSLKTVNGRKELKINENDVRDLNVNCKQVAIKIEDKTLMKRHLTKLSPEINFYHYEVFLTMIELLGEKNVERIEHFCFLKSYTRHGSPTELERDAWAHLCHDNSSLPEISQWRLPFLPKCDQYKLVIPELNLKTYEQWLSIAQTLKIQSHVICTMSIKGSVVEAWKSYFDDTSRAQTWSLYPLNSGLLKDIKKCIKRMEGLDGLYYGTAALYFVVNHTPQGADQVAAAQECFASAQAWEERSERLDESDERMIAKVKDKYLRLTSKHILHTHGVGDDKYTKLIGQPVKLIRELYNDESIPERFKRASHRRPDINAAANALGKLFSINMAKISYDYLLEWLRFDVWKEKHNESVTMGFGNSMPIAEDDSTEENNLLRACYILESGDTTRHVQFLIDVAFATENRDDGYGAGFRYRALRVLLSILDDDQLEELTKHDPASRREYMHSLRYLDELERLGLVYTLGSFEKCCKHTLAQILLKNLSYMPRALSLIVQICMDYKIYDYSLLDAALERMVRLSMVKELREFIPIVGSTISMINSLGYTAGWQLLLAHPFSKLDARCTPEQLSDCVQLLRFLYTCPIISKLDFKDVINQCFACPKAVHLAAALLPFLPENDRDCVMQKLKERPDLEDVINRLSPLSIEGVLVTPQTIAILKATVAGD